MPHLTRSGPGSEEDHPPQVRMVAYCVQCGADISHSGNSHVRCDRCLSQKSHSFNYCNICGRPMENVGKFQLAHEYCIVMWSRSV